MKEINFVNKSLRQVLLSVQNLRKRYGTVEIGKKKYYNGAYSGFISVML